jgi:nitrogen fixation NifU-like protein
MFEGDFAERILLHYEDPFHQGNCPRATHLATRESPLCGDWVRIDLVVTPDCVISEAWFDGEGCVISQSAASMIVQHVSGMTVASVRQFSAQEFLDFFGPSLSPDRQKCCLLAWRTLQSAVDCPAAYDKQDDNVAN